MKNVIGWEISLSFKNKNQKDSLVKYLAEQEIDYSFETYSEFHEGLYNLYYVHIKDMSWANNLKDVATFLESIDCNVG